LRRNPKAAQGASGGDPTEEKNHLQRYLHKGIPKLA